MALGSQKCLLGLLDGSCKGSRITVVLLGDAAKEELRRVARKKVPVPRNLDPDDQWQLRMKFLERAKSYIGVPYAQKYHQAGTPEYNSPLFLDCCGFIRRVMWDLTEEFGFCMGLGNQAYQYDTLPITLPSEEYLKPGDLIFISGTYFDTQRKRQPHDIVHVEIWLGYGERSLGARWKRGKSQVFDSYKFVSSTYGDMEYHFKSIETWLQGICVSHCPEHRWASAMELPSKRSIFCLPSEQGKDVGAEETRPQPLLRSEEMAIRLEPIAETVSNFELSSSEQAEALGLQSPSGMNLGDLETNPVKGDPVTGTGRAQRQSPERTSLEAAGPRAGGSEVSLEGSSAQEEGGCEEGPAHGQEAGAEARPPGPTQHSVRNPLPMSHSISKVNSKGVLAGGAGNRRKKRRGRGDSKCVANTREKFMSMFESQTDKDLQPEKQSSNSNLAEGELANETKPKGQKGVPKASPRMNHPEEKKPEESPNLGPFYYIGGANGIDILNAFCKNKGWQRIYDNRRDDYILKWCETKCRDTYFNFREGEQLLYQISNNKILTTKIGLLMNLREYERVMKKISRTTKVLRMEDFFPETFRLDTKDEREIFFEIYEEPQIWICKPTSSNQGRGIFLLKNQSEVNSLQAKLLSIEEDPMYKKLPYKIPPARIVQRYIDKPLLLEGKKFDVRSYLLIACTCPFMLFFGHGYVRLTCLNYDPKSEDLTSHLTNQYVQKKSPMYSHVKEETVWRMERFNNYVNERFRHIKGLPKDWVFNGFTKRMKEIMLQCFLAVKSKLECKMGYFDLIGCDFLIDEDFKVWLLEMNANPALHTNCSALKSIIPTVVNETLDLAIEIFTKSQKIQNILPLESLCHFALLYSGVGTDSNQSRPTKSRTSLRSLRSHRSLTENSSFCNSTYNMSPGRPAEKQPVKSPEKPAKGEAPAHSEGVTIVPSRGVPRNTLPMPQIQISIVPNLACCPSVKTILRGNQVCSSGNQYIIKHVPPVSDRPPEAEGDDERARAAGLAVAGVPSKDRSYAAWFQQTFGSKFLAASGNGAGSPLTSSQMVSLHLQSSLPPNLPASQEQAKPLRQLMNYSKMPGESGKALAAGQSCGESLPEEKKLSHRGS
ncbi:inactive polyglycylase TTLL10 isoform X4 [Podarcis raffonei]|uniref:inactive polyglycylase TTLL10 isoform X4 n=1 Tax=Podarcis raffonei TaxID=65483 RepID=UPI002329129F|nr:inactive polyglycylase TTLL10 isoform X4 [Podarcis raffonei]